MVLGVLVSGTFAQKKGKQEKPEEPEVETVNIVEALEKGLIEAEARGAGLEAVNVVVKRKLEKPLKVLVPVGTFFVNLGKAQDMVATKDIVIDLTQRKEASYSVPSASANVDRDVPGSDSKFRIVVAPESEELRKLMEVIAREKPSTKVKQVAVWIVTDDITGGKLDSRYVSRPAFLPFGGSPAASDEDVVRAISLVERAGIDVTKKTSVKERVSALKGLASEDKEVVDYSAKLLGYQKEKDINSFRLETLISALKDGEWAVLRAAAEALKKITGNDFGENYDKWNNWWQKNKERFK